MEKHWKIKPRGNDPEVERIAESLNIENILANLLVQRGIVTFDSAKKFFRPSLDDLYDPFLMKDMDKAVARIEKAIEQNEKILIYGDYDVDGTTAVAMCYSFLKKYHDLIDCYIPDRYVEGYGISYHGIDYACNNNFSLVIALDCGIKSIDKINYANYRKIDFIICDHHTPGETIPKAVAVLDSKRSDCIYPYKHLSGCGVGFKLLQAFAKKSNIPFSELTPYLDLICVSIASDIVPMTGENRILAFHGLSKLNENPCFGFKAIMKISGIENKQLAINDIVFKIGPVINAAGRIENGKTAVNLLIADNQKSADELAEEVNSYNTTRKDIDRNNTLEAKNIIDESVELQKRKTTVLFKPDWHKGIVGIVASRLTEYYYRPTVVLTESHGLASGSARSIEGYDLYKAVEACSDLLENYGGHMYAAGLTMKLENVEAFQKRFEDYVSLTIDEELLKPIIEIDEVISLSNITPKFFRILKQFAPFGPENMSPVFMTKNVTDYGKGKMVGKTNEHLKLDLMENDNSMLVMPAIAFNLSDNINIINKRIPFDICYTIVENEFNGKVNLQLMIKDIRIAPME